MNPDNKPLLIFHFTFIPIQLYYIDYAIGFWITLIQVGLLALNIGTIYYYLFIEKHEIHA